MLAANLGFDFRADDFLAATVLFYGGVRIVGESGYPTHVAPAVLNAAA